jgi:hypothetical protein
MDLTEDLQGEASESGIRPRSACEWGEIWCNEPNSIWHRGHRDMAQRHTETVNCKCFGKAFRSWVPPCVSVLCLCVSLCYRVSNGSSRTRS